MATKGPLTGKYTENTQFKKQLKLYNTNLRDQNWFRRKIFTTN